MFDLFEVPHALCESLYGSLLCHSCMEFIQNSHKYTKLGKKKCKNTILSHLKWLAFRKVEVIEIIFLDKMLLAVSLPRFVEILK